MDLGKIIAFNLNKLRTERSLTLGQLAKLSGISKAILSDIEKGGSNPTINTIWKIANGLNVPYTRLMEVKEPDRNFELFYCELDAESANASIAHSPRAQEYIYVIEGSLTLKTDTAVYELYAGDSLVFSSSVNHTYINDGKIKVKFMVINYYPY